MAFLNRTYGNIVQSKSFNFNTFMNYSLFKNTRIMLNLTLEYADLKSAQLNQHNSGWIGNSLLRTATNIAMGFEMECKSNRFYHQIHPSGLSNR